MRPNNAFASRIDLIGLPVSWSASLISCDIIPYPFSDPCAVLLSTKVPDVLEHGPGLWKLNCSVLRRMNTSISSRLFGRTGVPGESLFRSWRIGGREESLG